MSAALTKARRAAVPPLTIRPVADPVRAADVNLAFQTIQSYEMLRSARNSQSIPTFPAINLTSPDGTTWQISVGDDGALTTAQVPR